MIINEEIIIRYFFKFCCQAQAEEEMSLRLKLPWWSDVDWELHIQLWIEKP